MSRAPSQPVVANSFSHVFELADAPPPRFPKKLRSPPPPPLVLHILRVPGSDDLVFTPLPPVSESITADDIFFSRYYFRHTPPSPSRAQPTKDAFTFSVIRRDPDWPDQTQVGTIHSEPLPPQTVPPPGESWDGLFELEKPPIDLRIDTPGYAPFADPPRPTSEHPPPADADPDASRDGDARPPGASRHGPFRSCVIFARKKWYDKGRSKAKTPSKLPGGYSFAVPWFHETVGLYSSGRWAKCHNDGSGRCVFEDRGVGGVLEGWLYPPREFGVKEGYKVCEVRVGYRGEGRVGEVKIFEAGTLMLDLVVMAVCGVAWRKWERFEKRRLGNEYK